jgi:DNA primase
MPRISQRTIDQVKDKASIVDAMEGVELKRMGREYVTHCPWHEDRKPSLSISPQKNFAYCHVCQHGVDALGWLQDRGLTFQEAIERIAAKHGIQVEHENDENSETFKEEQKQRRLLYVKREQQVDLFTAQLFANREACLYLKERGISKATAEAWGLGFTGDRLMVPLRDVQGRTVAFTGRALAGQMPKYKNSPSDLLYDKSKLVFGLDHAAESIRKSREVVITEGQFDVIKCHQEGLTNVVACSGTALSHEQINNLVRRCGAKVVTLCFDGDAAGVRAAYKALEKLQEMVLSETITLRILSMPTGEDPDSVTREKGVDVMREMIAAAPNWVKWWLGRELGKVDLEDIESVQVAERGVKRILSALPVGGQRAYVERRAAEILGQAPKVKPAAPVVTKRERDARKWVERRAVRCYLLLPQSRESLRMMNLEAPPYCLAWDLIRYLEASVEPGLVSAVFGSAIRSLPEDEFHELRSLLSPVPEVLSHIQRNADREIADTVESLERIRRKPATAGAKQ